MSGLMAWLRRRRPAEAEAVQTREERDAAEAEAAADRWRAANASAQAAGCRCGRPATHVRKYGGTIGGVPAEVWSCEEHRNVTSWLRIGDGPYKPADDMSPEFDAAVEQWRLG